MTRILTLFFAVLLAPLGLQASASPELTLYPAAQVAMPSLAVPVGVRAVAMGGAYAAAGRDVTTLQWNPAGLARIGGYQLNLAHNEWDSTLGLRQEYLAYGMGVGQSSGLAVSINYFSLGTLSERSDTGALGQESSAYDFSGSAGFASSFFSDDSLKLGASLEYGLESLFGESTSLVDGSLGLQYDLSQDLTLGLSANHLGSAGGGFSPPSETLFGVAYGFNNRAAVVALDGDLPFNGSPALKAGLEVNLGSLALRAGWRQDFGEQDTDVQTGPTAGAGFKTGVFALDYAYVPYGELGSTQRVSVSIDLPADFFKPKLVGAESSTTTARAYYDKASELEKNGSLLQALVEYQRAKDAYPEALRPQPQNFYLSSLLKIDAIQKEMNKSGNNAQVRKLLAQYMADGQAALRDGRYRDAISNFRAGLKLDPDNKDAKQQLQAAEDTLRSRKSSLLEEAARDYRDGLLGSATERYRDVLGIDDGDADANNFFTQHRAEIKDFLVKIHRKGIDQYVGGNVREAIDTWRKGLKLDPSDPINFRRDIDKAQKLLDLRGGQ